MGTMKLTPKAYKRIVRITQCAYEYKLWLDKSQYKQTFISHWPEVYNYSRRKGIRYEMLIYYALVEVAQGELDGEYAKAFA